MSITFHCVHCNNKITAKDESAAKWGICPVCHNKIYIPDLNAEIDDLKLSPVDEEEEKKKKELMAETYQLTRDILQEREKPVSKGGTYQGVLDDKVLVARIVNYLRKMKDGKLAEAEAVADQITPYGPQAIQLLDKIASGEILEADLNYIPQAVLVTLLRNLKNKISSIGNS